MSLLEAQVNWSRDWVEGSLVFDLLDSQQPLTSGGIVLVFEDGQIPTNDVEVESTAQNQ